MLEVETWILVQEILQGLPSMGRGIIQQNNHRARQVSQQFLQEPTYLFLPDVVEEE